MTTRTVVWTLALLLLTFTASAQRVINEWGGAHPESWDYDPFENTIEITAADANTFSFETYDQSTGEPLNFDLIKVVGPVTGTVKVQVGADPNSSREFGARTVMGIDLSGAENGELAGVKISENLGTISGVFAKTLTDEIDIGGRLSTALAVETVGAAITIGENIEATVLISTVTAPITVDGNVESSIVDIGTLSSPLYIGGGFTENSTLLIGTATASITIVQELQGQLTAGTLDDLVLYGDELHGGTITVTNTYAGSLTCWNDYCGTITLLGDLTGVIHGIGLGSCPGSQGAGGTLVIDGDIDGGRIVFYGDVGWTDDAMPAASIQVKGSIKGARNDPVISVGSNLYNTIAVFGEMLDVNDEGPEIQVNNMGSLDYHRGAVAIDYDANGRDVPTSGLDDAAWRNAARVQVGATPYARDEGNSVSIRVWNVRLQRRFRQRRRTTGFGGRGSIQQRVGE